MHSRTPNRAPFRARTEAAPAAARRTDVRSPEGPRVLALPLSSSLRVESLLSIGSLVLVLVVLIVILGASPGG